MKELIVSPAFKYIGGKSWLRTSLRNEINVILSKKQVSYYIEPFAGGLGAFLAVYDILLNNNIKNIILNDINSNLISFYNIVKNNPDALIKSYMILENEFHKTVPDLHGLHKLKDKIKIKELLKDSNIYYNHIRKHYNSIKTSGTTEASSHLLFLQNHSFNGIYRENSKGEYNTPFNWDGKHYTVQKIRDKIYNIHQIFRQFNIVFSNLSYDKIDYSLNALYYLDPPYLNELTIQENKYHKEIFDLQEQQNLIKKIKDTVFIYSNHDSDILLSLFKKYIKKSLFIKKIARKNLISSSNLSRKTDKIEILVTHY